MARTRVTIKKPDFDKWKQAIHDLTVKTGLKIEQVAKESAPVNTGNYRSEITYDGANSVIAQAQYSADLEYGTADHGPVHAKALRFVKDGKVIFAKKVKGIKPFATMRNAAHQTQKEINKIFKEALRDNGL